MNRGWRFCRFNGVVNRVVSCWFLVCPAPPLCLLLGPYWTTFGLRLPVIAPTAILPLNAPLNRKPNLACDAQEIFTDRVNDIGLALVEPPVRPQPLKAFVSKSRKRLWSRFLLSRFPLTGRRSTR